MRHPSIAESALRSLLLLAGILLALHAPSSWQHALAVGGCAALVLLPWHRASRPLLLLVLGGVHAQLAIRAVDAPWLPDGERVLVEARVEAIPARSEAGWQFDARATFPRHPEWPARRLRMRLPAGAAPPAVGERWQYAARIDVPRDAAARNGLLRDHVAASAQVVDGPLSRRLAPARGGLDALRARLAWRIADRVADPSAAALLAALAVGVTAEVSARQWHTFNATGITHLVAISGMHVTFFAMLSMAAARWLWRPLAGRRGVPRREAFAAAVGIVLALLYALLSGFSVPAQRTAVMLAAFLVARECGRRVTPAWSVAVALAMVLAFDPMAALSAGFWLSFVAVAAIVLLAGARIVPAAPLPAAIQVQWLVTIALLPATLAIFGSFSAIGMLANAIAIPVFTLLLVPPVLLATACHLLPLAPLAWCGDQLVTLAGVAAASMWPAIAWLAGLPGALWWADPPLAWFLLAPVAAVLALLPVAPGLRLMCLALLGGIFLLREPRPRDGQLWIDVLDVGAATAVLLRTRRHLVLFGTGETFGSTGRRFERLVLSRLRGTGYPTVDLWLPGTLSRDAQAALRLGASAFGAGQVQLPPHIDPPPEMGRCQSRAWRWDGIDFAAQPSSDGRACLLSARRGDHALLLGEERAARLAGPATGEVRLLPRAAGATQGVVPAAGQLLVASVSADEWNSPAWQRQRVRLGDAGAVLLSTAGQGTLQLRLDATGIRARGPREGGSFSAMPVRREPR